MIQDVKQLIEELRSRSSVLKSKVVFQSPGFLHDFQLMEQAADGLQYMKNLEQDIESIRAKNETIEKETNELIKRLKRKGILVENDGTNS